MVSRLIKTKEDCSLALHRIEELMDAEAGTREADELELLAALVEMYEDQHYPMDLPDPIEAVKFRMEQLGLSQQNLVPFIGSRSKVSEVLNRKKPFTLAMMRGLHKGLGIPADVLLQEPGTDFPDTIQELDSTRFPLAEMAKRGWIRKVDNFREKAEELMRDYVARAGGFEDIAAAFFRKSHSARLNAKADRYAIAAWCLRVLELARTEQLEGAYRKGVLSGAVMREIARLSYFSNGPLLAREYLEKQGIHLIIVPHLSRTYLDGAALLLPSGNPVVGLTLRYDRIDHFWFCLLHELTHVAWHVSTEKQIIVDDLDLRKHERDAPDATEQEADELASIALIPKKHWEQINTWDSATSQQVKSMAEELRIHPAIIAGRIRFERNNYRLLSKLVGQGKVRELFPEYH